jgi:hypothetical protein
LLEPTLSCRLMAWTKCWSWFLTQIHLDFNSTRNSSEVWKCAFEFVHSYRMVLICSRLGKRKPIPRA